jgi:ubiquinone/menaquinone biosynthesis C-methylase UbiE
MIEIARSKAARLGIDNVHYTRALIFDERYGEESFDVVLAFRILHILEDIETVIGRINGLLKPGGVFISVTTCMGWYGAILGIPAFLLKKLKILPFHINFFALSDVQEVLCAGGFEIVEYEKMDDKIPTYCIVARKVKE